MSALAAPPGCEILTGVTLAEPDTTMQGFARSSPVSGSWYFTQVIAPYATHAPAGDLAMTHAAAAGATGADIISTMTLKGFGHGQEFGIQPRDEGGVWVWIEAVAAAGPDDNPDGFGTKIARFKWAGGTTITPKSAGVTLFDPHPGTYRNAPMLGLPDQLIGVRYVTADGGEFADVYDLAAFTAGTYGPLRTIPRPAGVPPGAQGHALMPGGTAVMLLTGSPTDPATNPAPGNTVLTVYDAAGILSQQAVTDLPGMTRREPEGVQIMNGLLFSGFASGGSGALAANLLVRPLPIT